MTNTTVAPVGEVTLDQKIAWLTTFMSNEIADEEWPEAGVPNEWDEDDWLLWANAGNRAVIERRADIEAGSVSAGSVWCAAANNASSFHFDRTTEEYLQAWFVSHRMDIDTGFSRLVGQILSTETRVLARGDLVAYNGLLYRVSRDQSGDNVILWLDQDGRRADIEVPRNVVRWLEPGVARLRRTEERDGSYTEVCTRGEEYVFERVYSEADRAIYIRPVAEGSRSLGYMAQGSFVPVPVSTRQWDQGRVLRTKQTVYTPNGEVGLVLAEDNHDDETHRDRIGRLKVYKRNTGAWRDTYVPHAEVNFAVAGDPIINHELTGLFVRNHNDEMIVVTVNGVEAQWRRQDCRYTGLAAAPKPPIENLIVTVGGIEYVRKDVIDKDIETMTTVLHKGSVEHSLCGVYDRVTAEADRRTEFIKMGPRYRTYEVEVEQTITIRRTIRVENVTDEDTARESARRIASDYYPQRVPGRRTGEPDARVRSHDLTDYRGTATVVA